MAISFLDYLFPSKAKAKNQDEISVNAIAWLRGVQEALGIKISYVSCGPGQEHTFPVRL